MQVESLLCFAWNFGLALLAHFFKPQELVSGWQQNKIPGCLLDYVSWICIQTIIYSSFLES